MGTFMDNIGYYENGQLKEEAEKAIEKVSGHYTVIKGN